ncbi:PLD-like domain protein [Chlamydia suis MD56]|uniref:phospholipase D-like domain-containing protein n=1 Tax=Chlamydia suis TaxID=83559 RepID=UPI0003BFF6A1|nr:phospholipase D-like domain-containing protein [Chlamydia suis]ESN89540.1 PLD-like domain protein [Chlamydia suis MD56]
MATPPSNNNNRIPGFGNSDNTNSRSTSRRGSSRHGSSFDARRVITQAEQSQSSLGGPSSALRSRLSAPTPSGPPPSYEEACYGEQPPSYQDVCNAPPPPPYEDALTMDPPPPYSERGDDRHPRGSRSGSRGGSSSSPSAGSRGSSGATATLQTIYEEQGARPRVPRGQGEGRGGSSGRTHQAAQRVLPRPLPRPLPSPEPSTLPIPYHRALQSVRSANPRRQPSGPVGPSEVHIVSAALGHNSSRQEILLTARAASSNLFLRSNAFNWNDLIELLIGKSQGGVRVCGRYNPEAGAPPPLPAIPLLDISPYYQDPRTPVRHHYQHLLVRDGQSSLIFCSDFSNNPPEGLDLMFKINSASLANLLETRLPGTVEIHGENIRYIPLSPNNQEGTRAIVQALSLAQSTIYICNTNINDPDILHALKQAARRHVDIVIILESSEDLQVLYNHAALTSTGYVTCLSTQPINTNFALIDNKTFIAGSAPWTMQGLESSYSDLLVISPLSTPNKICLQNFWSLLSSSVDILDSTTIQTKIDLALSGLPQSNPQEPTGAIGGNESPQFCSESYLEFCTQNGLEPDIYQSEINLEEEISRLSLDDS